MKRKLTRAQIRALDTLEKGGLRIPHCADCADKWGIRTNQFYCAEENVWEAVTFGHPEIYLCIDCFTRRVEHTFKRAVELRDFKVNVPINLLLMYGYELGRRDALVDSKQLEANRK